jgi:starch phosphorylase
LAALDSLDLSRLDVYHLNEGHAALVALGLLERGENADPESVRTRIVFTTHTPVSAGHDVFPWPMVQEALGADRMRTLNEHQCCVKNGLDVTHLAMRFSRYVNGVAMRHGEVARHLFPHHQISSITNGVHLPTWVVPPVKKLYDAYLPGWAVDPAHLRAAVRIPLHELREAHQEAKRALLEAVRRRAGVALDESALTLGFARRATAYKRPELLLRFPDKLTTVARRSGPLQIVYAGKAHPRDMMGKQIIRRIFESASKLKNQVRVVYLENYDMNLGRLIASGVDVWVNNPIRPLEASGTSGMKAAANGVPSFSILDGWWVEGHVEGVTGWSIGDGTEPTDDSDLEAERLLEKLERTVMPLYYVRTAQFAEVMRGAIALNASYFNTHRMMEQYMVNAYFPA